MRARYNIKMPLRGLCPKCTKKGIGIWDRIELFRSKSCRYCSYTVFHNAEFNNDGLIWIADTERMNSYNGGRWLNGELI